ncbi:MAG: hypothetical protein O2816_01685 [Planctomycetota bacterium]|nr:hypothetical protein [Planctomycetota bacterium]
MFVRDGNGDWVEEARLQPISATGNTPNFGHAVAIDDEHVVVGAPNDAEGTGLGAAFVFERSGGSWRETAKLITPPGVSSHWLGRAVDVSGDSVLVGEWAGPDASALVFDRVGGVWTFTAELHPPSPQPSFARRVVIEGDRAVASSFLGEGEVHVFERQAGAWVLEQSLTASDSHPGHAFGSAIDLDGDRLAVGAYGSLDQFDPGVGYVFDLVPTPGERLCFGDGSGAACPCGNEDTGPRGCVNGTGRGGDLNGTGTSSIAADDLRLSLFHLPADTLGFFALGTTDVAGGLGAPVYDGLLCIGGTVLRGPVFQADAAGFTELVGPLGSIPGAASLVEPGAALVYQAFYRDVLTSPCGTKGNLSNAYRVVYTP